MRLGRSNEDTESTAEPSKRRRLLLLLPTYVDASKQPKGLMVTRTIRSVALEAPSRSSNAVFVTN